MDVESGQRSAAPAEPFRRSDGGGFSRRPKPIKGLPNFFRGDSLRLFNTRVSDVDRTRRPCDTGKRHGTMRGHRRLAYHLLQIFGGRRRVTDLSNGRVIVTYGRSLMALTIAQSLGSRGVEVIGCDDVGLTALSFSRYAKRHFVHAPPATEPERFIDDLEAAIVRHKPRDGRPYVLMPCFQETRLIARHAARLSEHIKVAAPPIEAIRAVDPKSSLMQTLRGLPVSAPATWTLAEFRAAPFPPGAFPLIAKPAYGVGGRGVQRIETPTALASLIDGAPGSPDELLLQTYSPGQDYCLSVLFDRGTLKASAAYRNLSQFPRGAGAGVFRETVAAEPFLPGATTLFSAINWSGVAEIDFRWDGLQTPQLIEVNPRFWAGLFHTVESGVDFPWLLYELTASGDIETPAQPKLGQRTRVGGLYLLSAIQEIAQSEQGFAAMKAAWARAAEKFRTGNLRDAAQDLGQAFAKGPDLGQAAQRLKQALAEAKSAPNELFRSDDPLVSLGALFIVASLLRYGRLPPEFHYDPTARDFRVE